MEEDKWIQYILISAGKQFSDKNKFRYGIPAHTGQFQAVRVITQAQGREAKLGSGQSSRYS
jgi:hypothetical protein